MYAVKYFLVIGALALLAGAYFFAHSERISEFNILLRSARRVSVSVDPS